MAFQSQHCLQLAFVIVRLEIEFFLPKNLPPKHMMVAYGKHGKPDRSQVASLIWSEICQICLKLAIVMFCARNFKTGNCSLGVSFRLGHTLWNRVDSGEKCLQR